MPFKTNVFINCPFDKDYTPLLRPLIFTILYFKFEPQISQTISSSTIRIDQIKNYIRKSRYGIHDLSRSHPTKKGELPRFNMPYELGLDIGCAEYGEKALKTKKILILEKEKYHSAKVLSDIAGQDVESHNDDPETIIQKVRDWFSTNEQKKVLAGGSEIWIAFNQFSSNLLNSLRGKLTKKEISEMNVADYIKYAKAWISSN